MRPPIPRSRRRRPRGRSTAKRPDVTGPVPPSGRDRHTEGSHAFVAGDDAPRLDVFVAAHLDLSRNHAATLIANGHVLVNGRQERASYKARPGETVVVEVPAPRGRGVVAEDIPL